MSMDERNNEIGAMYKRFKDELESDLRQRFYDAVNSAGDMRFNHVGAPGGEELTLDGKFTLAQLRVIVAAWEQYKSED